MRYRCFLSLFIALTVLPGFGQEHENQPGFTDPVPPSPSTKMPAKIQDGYWRGQFERVNRAVVKAKGTKVVFFGDSITLRWSLAGAEGREIWNERFAKYRPINMGNSGDITPVMLYRTRHGNLDFPEDEAPGVAVLLCGTNNYVVTGSDGGKVKWDLGMKTPPREVADGIRAVARSFRRQLPETRLIVLGILPVKNEKKWVKCRETNRILATHQDPGDEVVFLDLEEHFLNKEGSIKPELFLDGTHLTSAGYRVMADALVPHIERLIEMGPLEAKQ